MSTIKNTYDNVEDIPQGMETIYTKNEETGTYHLPTVEGTVSKDRLDEFRTNNVNLRKEVEGYDVKIEGYESQLEEMKVKMRAVEDKFF